MAVTPKDIAEVASAIVVVGGSAFMVMRALKERKARKAGLRSNPDRCLEAEKRITTLEVCSAGLKEKVDAIDSKTDDIKDDLKTLIKMHLGDK